MQDVSTVVVLNDFSYVQGGASRVAIDEAVSLAGLGLDVHFIAAVGPIGEHLSASRVHAHCLDQPELLDVMAHPDVALQSMWNRAAHRVCKDLLKTLDPATTVVHLHGYTKALSTSPVVAARHMGFRTVCTLHDFFAACPNGAFFDYAQMRPCTRGALSLACLGARCDKRSHAHKVFRVARSAVQHTAGRFPSAVRDYIALSDRSAAIMRPYLPKEARFFPLANVLDLQQTAPVEVARNSAVVCIGRLDEEKGARLLAAAAANLEREVIFVGDGPLRSELQDCPNVTVTGWLSPQDVYATLGRARCLVFPSLWYETYGLVVAEAAGRGVPALVSDITAAAERVRHGLTGWHFRSGDAASLGHALQVLSDDAAVSACGRAAYAEYWQNAATIESHTRALIDIYRSVIERA